MKILIDTHTFLWHALNDDRLSERARTSIDNPDNDTAVSIVSLWEIGIKASIGKLSIPLNVLALYSLAESQSIDIIPISAEAIDHAGKLDWFNKDPFDRLIVSTALTRGDFLITIERSFEKWGVPVIW